MGKWRKTFEWIEEPYVSPDGEKLAAVVKTGEMEFGVCLNGQAWENGFDKVWYLRFTSDNRAAAIVSDTGMWTIAVDGIAWENSFEYLWDSRFSVDGRHVGAAVQKGRKYYAARDDRPWAEGFFNISNFTMAPDGGKTAAVVQTVDFKEGEIFKFKEGCFSVAVDGCVWENNFVNAWEIAFNHLYSPDGKKIAAIVSPRYGRWTMALDGRPWSTTFGGLVTDAVFSSDGSSLACLGKEDEKWKVMVDDKPWDVDFDMLWQPVFSPDGQNVAVKAEKNGKFVLAVNGRVFKQEYDCMWEPVFSPDGEKILVRAIQGGSEKYYRQVIPLKEISG